MLRSWRRKQSVISTPPQFLFAKRMRNVTVLEIKGDLDPFSRLNFPYLTFPGKRPMLKLIVSEHLINASKHDQNNDQVQYLPKDVDSH